MNIFFIDQDPVIAAQAMTDKHVIKMILESAQLLSTAHRVLDGYEDTFITKAGHNKKTYLLHNSFYENLLYRCTHINHPSAIWVRESTANYMWLYKHMMSLGYEYTKRYGKQHKTIQDLSVALSVVPQNIHTGDLTEIKVAITNEQWHNDDPIKSYRAYYMGEKLKEQKDLNRYMEVIYG
jgi:hypothetical protein